MTRPTTAEITAGLPGRFHILGVFILLILFQPGCSTADDPKGPEQILLDKAINALWGNRGESEIESLHFVSTVSHSDTTYRREAWYVTGSPRYREVRQHSFGIREARGLFDTDVWASVDQVVVPLDETEQGLVKMQPWLFSISLLRPLKNLDQFGLEHLGKETPDDGVPVERMKVQPQMAPDIDLVFEISTESWLVRSVTLNNRVTRETQRIDLSDYRDVQGMKFAYKITSYRNQKPYATDILEKIELNPETDETLFRVPTALNQDLIIEKNSIDGLMAYTPHGLGTKSLVEIVDELKNWIRANELDIAGPLVLLDSSVLDDQPAAGNVPTKTVCIPVSAPAATAELGSRDGFGVRHIVSRRALCITHVGDMQTSDLLDRLCRRAKENGMECVGPAMEIHFSIDGRTKQIQLPVN